MKFEAISYLSVLYINNFSLFVCNLNIHLWS